MAEQPKSADPGDTAILDWLEAKALHQGTDMGTAIDLIMRVPFMRRGSYHAKNTGEFRHTNLGTPSARQ